MLFECVSMPSLCHSLYIWQALDFIDSKKFKANNFLTILGVTLCVPALERIGIGADIFRQERICVEGSSCRWPAMGGPSVNAHTISGDKVNRVRQKYVGNQT